MTIQSARIDLLSVLREMDRKKVLDPIKKGRRSIERRKEQGYVRTNLGWIHIDYLHYGTQWGAVVIDEQASCDGMIVFAVKTEAGLWNRFNVFLAFLAFLEGNPRWFREIRLSQEAVLFRELTGDIPACRTAVIPDWYLKTLLAASPDAL